LLHRCNYILLQVYCVWKVVKTPTIIFNNTVLQYAVLITKYCAFSDETQKVGLSVLPFFHIYGFNSILNSTLQRGMHMVSLSKFNPEDYISCVVKFKVMLKQVIISVQLYCLAFCPAVLPHILSSCTVSRSVQLYCHAFCPAVLPRVLSSCASSRSVQLYCHVFCPAVLPRVLSSCTASLSVQLYCLAFCPAVLPRVLSSCTALCSYGENQRN
jgi:hypothetical protein